MNAPIELNELREAVVSAAGENGADLVGFAPAARFGLNGAVFKIFPRVKTVIGLVFRVLRGSYRGVEEGTTYYQYTTMGVENLEENIMPFAVLRVSQLIEENGFTAVPQRLHQTVTASEDGTNPEMLCDSVYRGRSAETQMDFPSAAVLCGLGEKGFHGALLTDDFGPMQRYCFILTDAEFEPTPLVEPHLCDDCKKCAAACPGKAIDDCGKTDSWQCAVYYSGANGTKNPFMPPDAYSGFENRLHIIAGEAKVTPETARAILRETVFYPPAMQSYASSICGRACDAECYIHLEEKGVLKKKFNTKFRKRAPWTFGMGFFSGDSLNNKRSD